MGLSLPHYNPAFDTYTLLNTLIHNATHPKLKQRYITCSSNYVGTFAYFNSAKDAYTFADYKGMESNAAYVIKAVQDCDRRPPHDTSQLSFLNKRSLETKLRSFNGGDITAGTATDDDDVVFFRSRSRSEYPKRKRISNTLR
ncbi:unnamed protein product [Lupinus luteus]|uniref:Uncharacterized protein n=1 Tax=Lupinus luteus TaxID=3873 RepID=A0AAV1Y118_LUPLU